VSSVPVWFARGVVQNLASESRAANAAEVVQRWESGKLPGFCTVFHELKGPDPDPCLSALVVAWMTFFDTQTQAVAKFLCALQAGEQIACSWFLTCVPRATTIGDLDGLWDEWILRQKRMIFLPGRTDHTGLERVRAELLLYPGRSGIPLDGEPYRRIGLPVLVGRRTEAWVEAFARGRVIALRLAAAGRGKAVEQVAELYCHFFEGLAAGESERKLLKLLDRAEKAFRSLESQLRETGAPFGRGKSPE
ncbi:MAG: hypothetical protein N2255_01520, partial [Kiritimatiellae bacterium]|nr:hypothetical protein [Kiritimatiellia bacterium]